MSDPKIPVKGSYQSSINVVLAFVASRAVDKKATMAVADKFLNSIDKSSIKKMFESMVKELNKITNIDKEAVIKKHINKMYAKSYSSAAFDKSNIEFRVKSMVDNIKDPASGFLDRVVADNNRVNDLLTELELSKGTIDKLQSENKDLKQEVNSWKGKWQNLAGNVMQTFGVDTAKVQEMSNTPAPGLDQAKEQKQEKSSSKSMEM